jgi:hypothetical protein
MRSRIRSWVMAAFLVMGLSVGLVHGAAAQTGQPPDLGLPPIKQPSSARFDIKGNITLGDQAITLSGNGSQAGTSVQLDMDLSIPGVPATTLHLIETAQRLYTRMGDDPQWQYVDLTQGMSGMPGMLPGMTGGAGGLLMGINPADLAQILQDAVHVQQVGKETLGGAPTTKYQIDIDLAKVVNGVNPGQPPDPQTQQILASAKYMMFLWVGDNDQYVHQVQIVLTLQIPDANNVPQTLGSDLMLTLRDFDTPITITEPTNAVPLDTGTGGVAMPIIEPPPVVAPPPVIAPPPNPEPGMPRTGAPAGLPLPLFLVLGLGLALLGVRMRSAECGVRNR